MPELPEVETIVRCLRPRLVGRRVEEMRILYPPLLRFDGRSPLAPSRGAQLIGLRRRGKMILMDFSDGRSLLFHLKMTGQLFLCLAKIPVDRHTRLVMSFQKLAEELRFRDVRKFGFVRADETPRIEASPELRKLGPEPLELGRAPFLALLRGRRGRLKSFLLNQSAIAGIGNIYADEILFEARLHPQSDVSRLSRGSLERLRAAMRLILDKAIQCRGTSVRDYRDGNGLEGDFQSRLRVYGRESLPCLRCGAKIKRIRLSGRSSFFCPRCQRTTIPRGPNFSAV
jgi:formamidopyrimidine-DNA glycosylase